MSKDKTYFWQPVNDLITDIFVLKSWDANCMKLKNNFAVFLYKLILTWDSTFWKWNIITF